MKKYSNGLRILTCLGLGLACHGAAFAQAAKERTVPFEWASGISGSDPQFTSASVASELGFFVYEGVRLDVTITNVAGGTGALPLVLSGRSQVGYTGSEGLLFNVAGGKDPGVSVFFAQNRKNIFQIAVLPDSRVRSVRDLKGTVIGMRVKPSAMMYYFTGLMGSLGLQPDKDFDTTAVGGGAGAVAELQKGNISAFVNTDTVFAAMENAGISFRYLDPGDYARLYSSGGIFAKRDYLASHRNEACAFGRGIAMGVEFTLANPSAAVVLHWKHYPESKPRASTPDGALTQSLHVLNSHLPVWDVRQLRDPRHGASELQEWEAVVKAIGLSDKISNSAVAALFTNEFVPCFNDFDREKLRTMAANYK